jgi:hypothetical protein
MKTVKDKLKQVETYNVEENWANIKEAILEATKESIRYKPTKKEIWIRTWNEELKQIINKKKHEYKKYLQTKDPQQHIKYKKLRAEVSKITRRIWQNDWDKFVKSLEQDITDPQRRGFKILKKPQLEVNDQIQTNLIPKKDWKTHYSKLWFNPDIQEEGDEEMVETTDYEEDIIMEELDLILKKKLKIRRALA